MSNNSSQTSLHEPLAFILQAADASAVNGNIVNHAVPLYCFVGVLAKASGEAGEYGEEVVRAEAGIDSCRSSFCELQTAAGNYVKTPSACKSIAGEAAGSVSSNIAAHSRRE